MNTKQIQEKLKSFGYPVVTTHSEEELFRGYIKVYHREIEVIQKNDTQFVLLIWVVDGFGEESPELIHDYEACDFDQAMRKIKSIID